MRLITTFFLLFLAQMVFAQTPVANFTLASTACLEQNIEVTNTSTNASSYEWDFCLGDAATLKTSVDQATITGLSGGSYGYKLVKAGTQWHGFAIGNGDHKLYRLDFGSSPENTPTITSLGNPGGLFVFPEGIDIVEDNGNWYGFVGSFNTGQGIIQVNFGSSLLNNTPTGTNIGNFGNPGQRLREVKVVKQGGNLILVIVGYNSSAIIRVNFRNSFSNTITAGDIYSASIAEASLAIGIEIIKKGTAWIALLASVSNSKILQLNFGTDILSTPSVEGDYTFTGVTRPYRVKLIREGETYYAAVANESAAMKVINFKDLNPANAPAELVHAGLPVAQGLESFRSKGRSIFQATNPATNKLRQVIFETTCDASLSFSSDENPPWIKYTTAGTKSIELIASTPSESAVIGKNISVSATVAPDISFTNNGVVCAGSAVTFTAVNTSGNIQTYNWNFGDSNTGTGASTSHAFSAGNYTTVLNVLATNTCQNSYKTPVTIFTAPVTDFSLPSNSPLCTNQQFEFENKTTFDPASNPTWEWLIDASPVSTAKDLEHTFVTSSTPTITLKATIPGCTVADSQVLTSLLAGPEVDFTTTGVCSNDAITFTNTTLDAVTGYEWNFADGQTSTSSNTNVFHTYTTYGTYNVSLMGSSANGCQNSKIKSITIYTKPQPDFSLSLPPFACSGATSQFNDVTPNPVDSNLSSWLWDFNDVASSQNSSLQRHPQHVYENAGPYEVSLTVTTNFGCSATRKKQISIAQSPEADFTNTPSCKDQPVTFTDASSSVTKSWYWQIGSASYYFAKPIHIFTTTGNHIVNLTVTGSNDCISYISKTVNVPVPVTPDFSFQKNCNNQNTIFTDITAASADAVHDHNWEFGSLGTGSGSPVQFTFPTPGNIPVKLTTTTVSGCTYSATKSVPILSAPVASFTATPEVGVPPLTVNFTNTSTNATVFSWAFNDGNGSVSQAVSPVFVFNAFGDYVVDLTATNVQGCSTVSSKLIKAILPVKDIWLMTLTTVTNPDGSLKIVAVLKNNSNVEVTGFPITLDLSGFATVREKVTGPIAAGSVYSHVFSYEISEASRLDFLCATAETEDDINTENNSKCVSLSVEPVLFEYYPNPANEVLNIKWIANDTEPVLLTLTDAMGKQVFGTTLQSVEGFNTKTMRLEEVNNGLYILILKTSNSTKTSRLIISH